MVPGQLCMRVLAGMRVTLFLGGLATLAWAGDKGPAVGDPAPDIGERTWIQKESQTPRQISELRGKVVLVQCFAYYCDP